MNEEETIQELLLMVDTVVSEENLAYIEDRLVWLSTRVTKLKTQNKEMREGLEAYGR